MIFVTKKRYNKTIKDLTDYFTQQLHDYTSIIAGMTRRMEQAHKKYEKREWGSYRTIKALAEAHLIAKTALEKQIREQTDLLQAGEQKEYTSDDAE